MSEKNARLVLSYAELDAAKANDILVNAGIIASEGNVTAAQAQEILNISALNSKKVEEILLEKGLISEKTKKIVIGAQLSKEELIEILRSEGMSTAKAKETISRITNTGAITTETGAVKLLTLALWDNIKMTLAWLATDPVGWIVAAVAAIGIAITAHDKYSASAKKVAAANKKIEESEKNISKLDDEISSLESLSEKLEDAHGNKSALIAIQKELNSVIGETPGLVNGEEAAYESATKTLNGYIEAKKQARLTEANNKIKAQKQKFDNTSIENKWGWDPSPEKSRKIARYISARDEMAKNIEQFREGKKDQDEYNKKKDSILKKYKYKNFSEYQNDIETIGIGGLEANSEEISKYISEQTELARDMFSDYISEISQESAPLISSLLDSTVTQLSGWSNSNEIKKTIDKLANNAKLKKAAQELIKSGTDDNVDAEEAYETFEKIISELKKKFPELKLILDDYFKLITSSTEKPSPGSPKPQSLTQEEEEKTKEYNELVADLADKEKEFAKTLRDHDKTDHLEKLKADLSEHKSLLDAYASQLEVLEWGSNLLGEKDYAGKSDLLANKMSTLQQQGQALRKEFERIKSIVPQTGDEAVELANRLNELGGELRSNATATREAIVEMEKLKIDAIFNSGNNYLTEISKAVDNLEKRIDALKNNKEIRYKSKSKDSLFPSLDEFDEPIKKKRNEAKQLTAIEQQKQDEISRIMTEAVKKQNADNAAARAEERQKLIEDMEKTRAEVKEKLNRLSQEVKDIAGRTVDECNQILSGVKGGEVDFSKTNQSMEEEVEKVKQYKSEIDKALGEASENGAPGSYRNPLNNMDSYTITGKYKENRGNHLHGGIDVAAPTGTKVYAPTDGEVSTAGTVGDFGKAVYIQANDGNTLIFAHLSKIGVKTLQKVKKGDVIGEVGSTGRSTGPHLHYEVRESNGKTTLDPNKYINQGGIPKVYSQGTSAGNAKAKNIGIAGENYKSEILVDKVTGKMQHVNKPTLIDTSKTDVVGEKNTANIVKNKLFADGTGAYNELFMKLFEENSKTSVDDVIEQLEKPFKDTYKAMNEYFSNRTREIESDITLSSAEQQKAINGLLKEMVDGNESFRGLGYLAEDMTEVLSQAKEAWVKLVHDDKANFNEEMVSKFNESLSSANDWIDKSNDYINNYYSNVQDLLMTPYNDRYEDSQDWISFMESLDSMNTNAKIAANARMQNYTVEQFREIAKADLPAGVKDELFKQVYSKYESLLTEYYSLNKERYIKTLDDALSKEEMLRDVLQQQFDILNKMDSAEKEAHKALRTSLIGSQYLDPETRKLVYNEDDYKAELKIITKIRKETTAITEEYYQKIKNLSEDDLKYKEQITNEYKRQLSMKEKELEIAQREVDLQKRKDELNNVLAERNVRQIINGKWEWVADTDKVREATEAFADAQYELQNAQKQSQQQITIDSYNARMDAINMEKAAADEGIRELQERVMALRDVINNTAEPISELGDIIQALVNGKRIQLSAGTSTSNSMYDSSNSIMFYNDKYDYKDKMNGYEIGSNEWVANNIKRDAKIDDLELEWDKITEESAHAELAEIREAKRKASKSRLEARKKLLEASTARAVRERTDSVNHYASGTQNAKRGWAELCELGDEIYFTRGGQFRNMTGNEVVFKDSQVRTLWEMSLDNGKGLFTDFMNRINIPTASNVQTVDNGVTLNGDIVIENPADFNEFTRRLIQAFKRKG